jgi:hypothetical protein
MSNLLDLTSSHGSIILNIQEILAQIAEEYAETTDPGQREALLNLHHSSLNIVQAQLQPQELQAFLVNRSKHYRLLLAREVTDSEGLADSEALERVTAREIAAGRMTEGDPLRRMALEGAAAERAAQEEDLARARIARPSGFWQRVRSALGGGK